MSLTLSAEDLAVVKEAGLAVTEVQRPPSLMEHVIALRAEVQELRQQLDQE